MDVPRALGSFDDFVRWTRQPHAWDGTGRVWFAGGVLPGLAGLLDEHLEWAKTLRGGGYPAALGCVPWLSSQWITERLAARAACVVIGKLPADRPYARTVHQLMARGEPFPAPALPAFRTLAPTIDGRPTIVGPYGGMPADGLELGPVRVAGYREHPGRLNRLLHAKVLVLGATVLSVFDTGEGEYEELGFEPWGVWVGSANWTAAALDHLEVGLWSEDRDLVDAALGFVSAVVAFSEPFGSTADIPVPELRAVDYDDDEMAEAWREMMLDHEASEAEDDEGLI